jgi:hypothetical protein
MSYRDRRAARAERLREWADKREAKADAAHETAQSITGRIPMGQPILLGHHSQRRHERDIERANNATRKSLEHGDKAREFRDRADNIQAAAEHAIYSDDEDATQRLTERIVELETRRDAIKAANAAYRKAHRDELKAMSAYARDRAVPHPSYELTNLSATINRNRKRLATLQAQAT